MGSSNHFVVGILRLCLSFLFPKLALPGQTDEMKDEEVLTRREEDLNARRGRSVDVGRWDSLTRSDPDPIMVTAESIKLRKERTEVMIGRAAVESSGRYDKFIKSIKTFAHRQFVFCFVAGKDQGERPSDTGSRSDVARKPDSIWVWERDLDCSSRLFRDQLSCDWGEKRGGRKEMPVFCWFHVRSMPEPCRVHGVGH